MPRLTVAGDLDGLIRSSRIAEDIEHHVFGPIDAGQDEDQARMDHSVVLIPGMVRYMRCILVHCCPTIRTYTFAHILCNSHDVSSRITSNWWRQTLRIRFVRNVI